MADVLHGYECVREIYLQFLNGDSLSFTPPQGDVVDDFFRVPQEKIKSEVAIIRSLDLTDELSVTVEADFVRALRLDQPNAEEPFFPLADPFIIGNLRVRARLGYQFEFQDRKFIFNGILNDFSTSFNERGVPQVTLRFFDDGFEMSRIARYHRYPAIASNIDGQDDARNRANYTDDGAPTEIFNASVDEARQKAESNTDVRNSQQSQASLRDFAVGDLNFTISLFDIFTSIIESYGYSVGSISEQLQEEVFTQDSPLCQDRMNDWLFIQTEAQKRGFQVVRKSELGQIEIDILAVDLNDEQATDNEIRFAIIRPGQKRAAFDPFDISGILAQAPIQIPGPRASRANLRNRVQGRGTFIFQGGLDINIDTSNFIGPNFRTFTDEATGEIRVLSQEKTDAGNTIEVEYRVNEAAVDLEVASGNAPQYIRDIITGKLTFEDALARQLFVAIDRDSNDDISQVYGKYRPCGWTTSGETLGNPFAIPGKWYFIEGLGPTFSSQKWRLTRLTHSFTHTWRSNYDFER